MCVTIHQREFKQNHVIFVVISLLRESLRYSHDIGLYRQVLSYWRDGRRLSGAIVLGSALRLYYYLRVMVTLYMREPGMQMRDTRGDWALSSGGLVVLLSAIMVVALSIYPQPVISQVQGLQNRVLR